MDVEEVTINFAQNPKNNVSNWIDEIGISDAPEEPLRYLCIVEDKGWVAANGEWLANAFSA